MVNRFMKIMVFFDLPVSTKAKRKAYTQFRNRLIKEGFIMLQYSVYARTVRNSDDAAKYVKRVKSFLPEEGSVRIMTVTDKQYNAIEIVVGKRLEEEDLLDTKDIIEL